MKTLKQRLNSLLYPPKKYHWYEVRYKYYKNSQLLFSWTAYVGLSRQATTLNERQIKLIPPPVHKMTGVDKSLLVNGVLLVEFNCYLGKFRRDQK